MRLIVKADLRRHVGERLTAEDPVAGGLEPATEDVRVGREPEDGRERSGSLGRAGADRGGRGPDRDRLEEVRVEVGAEMLGQLGSGENGTIRLRLTEGTPDLLDDERQAGLGFEQVVDAGERIVEGRHAVPKATLRDDGLVDGPADQMLAEGRGFEVEDALAEPGRRGRPAVVDDMRWEDADPCLARGVRRPVQLVADRSVVDDEDRPDVVRVRRVGVRRECGVEDLTHSGQRRLPGSDDPILGRDVHRRIVQDGAPMPAYRRLVDGILPLVAFSFVSSVTPGPNNVLLWASGAEFGLRATLRHVFGTALGIGAMALAVAAGLGALIAGVPELAFGMRLAGSLYLLFLAYQIAGAHGLARGDVAHPLGLRQAAALQLINPKAWIFALGAVTTFRPADLSVAAGSLTVAATMMAVIVPTATLWAGAGGVLGRLLTDDRRRRATSLVLAALVVATVVSVWV